MKNEKTFFTEAEEIQDAHLIFGGYGDQGDDIGEDEDEEQKEEEIEEDSSNGGGSFWWWVIILLGL